MSWNHTKALENVAGGATQRTKAFDCARVCAGSFQVTLAGSSGSPSLAIALEGSNAVPPPGQNPGPGGAGVSDGWKVPDSSWVALGGGSPITATLSADGTKILLMPDTALLTRWVRCTVTPAANTGGTITVEVFLRDTGS